MLKNELSAIEELLLDPQPFGISKFSELKLISLGQQIRKAWEEVAFSDIPEHSLVRYFTLHLKGISKLSDTLSNFPDVKRFGILPDVLLELIDHLRLYYLAYLDLQTNAPFVYYNRAMHQMADSTAYIRSNLQSDHVSLALRNCLSKWLYGMSEGDLSVSYSFDSVSYFEAVVHDLSLVDYHSEGAENNLKMLLIRMDFNHLAFFVYCQEAIRKPLARLSSPVQYLDFLMQERAAILSLPEIVGLSYDNNWPSVKTMMSGWLQEEIQLAEHTVQKELAGRPCSVEKMPLDLSVSQLACLIRLFFEENKFSTEKLKTIFIFFSANYRTKRQPVISSGSLSKEFYSVNQKTAAQVLDMLQKMVVRINRNFFPILVAINIAVHVYQDIH